MSNCTYAPTGRRHFLRSTAGGLLVLRPETVFGTQANPALQLGVVGCGGRGNWIAGHFTEFTNTRVVALADAFRDPLEEMQKKFRVDPSRLYEGLDGFHRLLASDVDAVAIESPPYYHPEQAAAAVAAGKHVYLAKPVAVDVAGCRAILDSAAKAKGKLSFLVDFQTRTQPVFQEAARRIHSGEIGYPVLCHAFYHAGRLNPKDRPGMPPAQARLRNWVFDKALSGDIIVEQNIHVLDVANWYLRSHPTKAFGTGGRKARIDVGDCWDHFLVTYWYPQDVKVDFSSAQFTKGYSDLCIRLYGSAGTVDSHYGGSVNITGERPWKGADKDDTFRQGAITNVKNFVESVGTGKYLNNAAESVDSNLTAILGRMAAYGERVVGWDEMLRSNQKLEADLKL
jgi:myo-inositol 2-dehydrogenase / D-chiro-inositol 1-dehydrogenase